MRRPLSELPRLPRWAVFSAEHVPIASNRHVLESNSPRHGLHGHDFVEVAVLFGGEGTHRSPWGEERVGRGSAFVLGPGSRHAYRDCRALEVYNCCFGAEVLERELAWVRDDPHLCRLFAPPPNAQEPAPVVRLRLPDVALETCRDSLDALATAPGYGAEARAHRVGRLLLLLGTLARYVVADEEASARRTAGPHGVAVAAARLLEGEPARAWSLAALAEALAVDQSYLVRLFKAATGLPPMAYLTRLRAERAAALLLSTDDPVSRVGATVGWADPNYFARRFRAFYGVSPSAYRSSGASAEESSRR